MDFSKEISKLKKEKNCVILAHFYQTADIQDIADFIGDSLQLSQTAAETAADIILFCGVNFMAETAKILSPCKKVLLPEPAAGCSLADSCKVNDLKEFLKDYPNHTVVSYVNTSVEVKAMTDICCTSGNAVKIIENLPENEKIVFLPDRNLGSYIKSITKRDDMIVWDGACHVHEEFSVEKIIELKNKYPGAKVLAHPECKKAVLILADKTGSTSALLEFSKKDDCKQFIVATESGILHQMQLASPQKTFIPAPPVDSTCGCNDCKYMKMLTLEKVYNTLKNESPEVVIDVELIEKAKKSILRMLEMSK
ncbi:MAG: quinolinate synthase NadA [Prevotellaceae bacterium]|jgi:quinolinate synthase|nr:quinolinate synthase NadA [Prevotellaceae bacterium]